MKTVAFYLFLIFPVSLWAQFDGIVGSEGCKAIHCDAPQFIEWATGCVVTRGYMNIAQPQNGYASYGADADATGKVTESTVNVVSLGDGGEAILTFQTPLANGTGYDFAVFENSFDDYFLELAFVEISSDNIHYFRFPATSNTQTVTQVDGYDTLYATLINNLAGKYRAGWGTPFDLDELPDDSNLDKNNIRYVKIIDVVGYIHPDYATYDANGNIINDPYPTPFASSGFDLAGVGVINNQNNTAISIVEFPKMVVYPNPVTDKLRIAGMQYMTEGNNCELQGNSMIEIYNMLGQPQMTILKSQMSVQEIDVSALPKGIYVLKVDGNSVKFVK
ncbi:MAG: T9SS type A sorting domain-containing protein [Bacteroidales bacterium]|jgi:hypothetical protein|nr:T9SS type A sorting domain-containing protein [Bacteroidales bacterium]